VSARPIPEATVQRLPVYLRMLLDLADRSTTTVSSEALASSVGVNPAKIRKDLSFLGSYGTRGVGYDVDYLIHQISRALGLTHDWSTAIVGLGNLGQALANYGGFAERGFRIAALLDVDPDLVGQTVAGHEVLHVDELDRVVKEEEIAIGVLTVPERRAQEVADRLVAAGVTSILNFAPSLLSVPEHVSLRKVDLSIELQVLTFYEQRRQAEQALGLREHADAAADADAAASGQEPEPT